MVPLPQAFYKVAVKVLAETVVLSEGSVSRVHSKLTHMVVRRIQFLAGGWLELFLFFVTCAFP